MSEVYRDFSKKTAAKNCQTAKKLLPKNCHKKLPGIQQPVRQAEKL
jgi:hypothetical protein